MTGTHYLYIDNLKIGPLFRKLTFKFNWESYKVYILINIYLSRINTRLAYDSYVLIYCLAI